MKGTKNQTTEGNFPLVCCNPFKTYILKSRPPCVAKNGANTSDSTAMSLIRMLSDGPDVSLRGSPMVSPMTAALWGSDPFGPSVLACSEAPAYQTRQNPDRESKHKSQNRHFYQPSNAYLNVLLGIIPSTTRVGCRDGNLQM